MLGLVDLVREGEGACGRTCRWPPSSRTGAGASTSSTGIEADRSRAAGEPRSSVPEVDPSRSGADTGAHAAARRADAHTGRKFDGEPHGRNLTDKSRYARVGSHPCLVTGGGMPSAAIQTLRRHRFDLPKARLGCALVSAVRAAVPQHRPTDERSPIRTGVRARSDGPRAQWVCPRWHFCSECVLSPRKG